MRKKPLWHFCLKLQKDKIFILENNIPHRTCVAHMEAMMAYMATATSPVVHVTKFADTVTAHIASLTAHLADGTSNIATGTSCANPFENFVKIFTRYQ